MQLQPTCDTSASISASVCRSCNASLLMNPISRIALTNTPLSHATTSILLRKSVEQLGAGRIKLLNGQRQCKSFEQQYMVQFFGSSLQFLNQYHHILHETSCN